MNPRTPAGAAGTSSRPVYSDLEAAVDRGREFEHHISTHCSNKGSQEETLNIFKYFYITDPVEAYEDAFLH